MDINIIQAGCPVARWLPMIGDHNGDVEGRTYVRNFGESLAVVLARAGVYPSFNQARKAGADLVLQRGYQEFRFNKHNIFVYIWYPAIIRYYEDCEIYDLDSWPR